MSYGEGKTREQEARDSARMLAYLLIYALVILFLIGCAVAWWVWL